MPPVNVNKFQRGSQSSVVYLFLKECGRRTSWAFATFLAHRRNHHTSHLSEDFFFLNIFFIGSMSLNPWGRIGAPLTVNQLRATIASIEEHKKEKHIHSNHWILLIYFWFFYLICVTVCIQNFSLKKQNFIFAIVEQIKKNRFLTQNCWKNCGTAARSCGEIYQSQQKKKQGGFLSRALCSLSRSFSFALRAGTQKSARSTANAKFGNANLKFRSIFVNFADSTIL